MTNQPEAQKRPKDDQQVKVRNITKKMSNTPKKNYE